MSQRLGFAVILLIVFAGAVIGFVLQAWRSASGYAPFAPPYSLAASLIVLAVLLVILALRLKSAIEHKDGKRVNPFHAVRLLAAARASQITSSVFIGFGVGLLVSLSGRTVGVSSEVWLPMLLTTIGGAVLLAAGLYAENSCRVPPTDDTDAEEQAEGTAPA